MLTQGNRIKQWGAIMMIWVLGSVLALSAALFIGGLIYSFRAAGRMRRNLTLAGMMF
jgi:hypothetical protein